MAVSRSTTAISVWNTRPYEKQRVQNLKGSRKNRTTGF